MKLLKSKEISILVIASLILLPFLGGESFAQSNQVLTVTTEKESYAAGEPVVILGLVDIKLEGIPALIQVYNPIGNKIHLAQVDVDIDGSFSEIIKSSITNKNWKADGTYMIQVDYGENSIQLTFEYGGMMSAGVQTTPEFAMNDDDSSQTIVLEDNELSYELTCAEILGMTPDTEMKSLIVEIKTDCDGELKITLPKEVIDTDEEGFFVLVDGEEVNHDAVSVPGFWTLTIPFTHNSEEIEIIGTFVIPEFGTIAMIVLVTSIGTIVIISAKNKQIFYSKI